jgi:hypothetical protein
MSTQVDAILQQIEQLDEAGLHLLRQRLNELADAEWRAESEKAQAVALQLGVDQIAIDRAIHDLRYGQ